MWPPLGETLKVHEFQKLTHSCQPVGPGPSHQSEFHILGYALMGEQGVILEDHTNLPIFGRNPCPWSGDDAGPQLHLTFVGGFETGQKAQKGRLATAAGAHYGEDAAWRHSQAHTIDGLNRAERLAQPTTRNLG